VKTILLFLLLLISSLVSESQEISLAITNCNVISMKSEKVLYHKTILISNDKILKIIPAGSWKNNGNIKAIDGSGKFVIPLSPICIFM
jgi:imidazolonepropionase-like amidohydrolase